MSQKQAVYLYCFALSEPLGNLDGLGVDGSNALAVHRMKSIAAVISMVSVDEFTGPEAEARFQDIDWIGPRALHHESVIERAMELSPVLPARFGTLFSSLDRLEALIARHRRVISQFLEDLKGKGEWSVKGFVDRHRARQVYVEAELAAKAALLAGSPGARYLQEQRIKAAADREVGRRVRELCDRVLNALGSSADQMIERTVLPGAGGAKLGDMVVNWAFLIAGEKLDDFRKSVDSANEENGAAGLAFQFSGPWPPYSFTPLLSMGNDE